MNLIIVKGGFQSMYYTIFIGHRAQYQYVHSVWKGNM